MKRKEDQVETFETMDESFGELAKLLQFRDKEQERVERAQKKRKGELSAEDVEMDAWDKEMKVCTSHVVALYIYSGHITAYFLLPSPGIPLRKKSQSHRPH